MPVDLGVDHKLGMARQKIKYQDNGIGELMAELKTEVTQDMRRVFVEHNGFHMPDETILIWWNQQVKQNA